MHPRSALVETWESKSSMKATMFQWSESWHALLTGASSCERSGSRCRGMVKKIGHGCCHVLLSKYWHVASVEWYPPSTNASSHKKGVVWSLNTVAEKRNQKYKVPWKSERKKRKKKKNEVLWNSERKKNQENEMMWNRKWQKDKKRKKIEEKRFEFLLPRISSSEKIIAYSLLFRWRIFNLASCPYHQQILRSCR